MFKKIKKYFLLIPTLIVMMFNCVCYGQVVFSASAIDYNTLFHPFSESGLEDYYNITDSDAVMSKVHSSTGGFSYYVYALYATPGNYQNLLNGDNYTLNFTCVLFNDLSLITETDSFIYIQKGVQRVFRSEFKTDFSNVNNIFCNSGYEDHYEMGFSYNKLNGTLKTCWSFSGSMIDPNSSDGNHYFYQASNIPDFPFFYDFDSAASALNVEVVFTPQLSGEVDRSVTLDDGSTAFKNSITMAVYNRSNFDVQYQMHIYRKDDYPESGGVAPGVYSVFTYYEKDWVYSHDLDSNADWWNKVEKQYKATHCHLVWSGRTDVVTFDFNQLPLSEGVDYTVVVSAVRNDYKYASEHYVSDFEDVYPDLFQVQGSQIVFRSDFSMKQYSDVKYDRNNTNNGVLPYQGKDDKLQYDNSYYAKEDDLGNVDYEGKDVYNDPSSWYNNELNHNFDPSGKWYDGLVGDKESGGSSDGTFTSFVSSFTNYFQFLSYVFNYFPVGIKNLFLVGFAGIMVVVLVKVIFK